MSLGCAKALVDSERILTELRSSGYELVVSYEDAQVVVVTGCLGERPDTIRRRHPTVTAVTGEGDVDGVMNAVAAIFPPESSPLLRLTPNPRGVKLTPRHYAYLKIAEGCDHSCSFCIIPQLRGGLRSRDAADVLTEATRLVATGTRELIVIAQDTSAYGDAPGEWIGRSVYDAPEVDGTVSGFGDGSIRVGDRVVVRIDEAGPHDLSGEVVRDKPWNPAVNPAARVGSTSVRTRRRPAPHGHRPAR